ncbi:MAG: cell division protein SepF [Candidatus Woesearchaeota archaeon]
MFASFFFMTGLFSKISRSLKRLGSDDYEFPVESADYVEVLPQDSKKSKILIRPFILEDFEDIKPVIDSLREGYTIALVNIRPLRDRDLVELKRAINKLKKTCDAVEADIAGFGEDWIAVAPSFASIYREEKLETELQ